MTVARSSDYSGGSSGDGGLLYGHTLLCDSFERKGDLRRILLLVATCCGRRLCLFSQMKSSSGTVVANCLIRSESGAGCRASERLGERRPLPNLGGREGPHGGPPATVP